jgi:hypothetical protein
MLLAAGPFDCTERPEVSFLPIGHTVEAFTSDTKLLAV